MNSHFQLFGTVDNPHDPSGGTQEHWCGFSAKSVEVALVLARLRVKQWSFDFGTCYGATLWQGNHRIAVIEVSE